VRVVAILIAYAMLVAWSVCDSRARQLKSKSDGSLVNDLYERGSLR